MKDVHRVNSDLSMTNRGPLTLSKIERMQETVSAVPTEPERKQSLSKKTIAENAEQSRSHRVLNAVAGAKFYGDMERIAAVDAEGMLSKVAKDLKRTDYRLSRLVTAGTDHFIKLKVTTQLEIEQYKENLANFKDYGGAEPELPFTRLEVIDQNPLQCMVTGDGRRGTIRMVMRGKLPDDLKLYASEIYQDPNELNSSWTIEKPRRVVTFNLSEARSLQMNNRSRKTNNGDNKQQIFSNLFLKFESMEDF